MPRWNRRCPVFRTILLLKSNIHECAVNRSSELRLHFSISCGEIMTGMVVLLSSPVPTFDPRFPLSISLSLSLEYFSPHNPLTFVLFPLIVYHSPLVSLVTTLSLYVTVCNDVSGGFFFMFILVKFIYQAVGEAEVFEQFFCGAVDEIYCIRP